ARDEKSRPTVFDALPPGLPFLSAVGRLDKAPEGLLLFTNDSESAAPITYPATHLPKTYHVQMDTRPDEGMLHRIRQGAGLDVVWLPPQEVNLVRLGDKNSG